MINPAILFDQTTGRDPLITGVGSAVVLHVAIIFGISFINVERNNAIPPSLEVIIQQTETDSSPETADYLSNVNADGGGESEERKRQSAPFTSSEMIENDGLAPSPMLEAAPAPSDQQQPEIMQQVFSDVTLVSIDTSEQKSDPKPRIDEERVEQSLDVASMLAETRLKIERYTQRPRVTRITARTRQSEAALYMNSWVDRVERIGNLNYPTEARRKRLRGALILSVAINKDGSLHELLVKRSSGNQTLDEAALDIVRQAAPFDRLEGKLAKNTDILYITRTWTFESQTIASRE